MSNLNLILPMRDTLPGRVRLGIFEADLRAECLELETRLARIIPRVS